MKNVLFIVYYFPPMGGSGVQRPLKFIKYLREFGWNPIVVCPEPGIYSHFDSSLVDELERIAPEVHRVQARTLFHSAGSGAKEVSRIPDFVTRGIRRFLRLFMYPDNKKGWIKPAVQTSLSLIDSHSIDLIFSTAPPFSNHLAAAQIKKETGIPLVLDYRDAWLNNHFMKDMFGWQKRKMRRLEEQCLYQADAVVGLDNYMLQQMAEDFPGNSYYKEMIPHGFDPDDFESGTSSTLDYKEGKFNILYSGLFYESNQPDIFISGIEKAIEKEHFSREDIHLHFQGGLDARIHSLLKKAGLENCYSNYGYLPHDIAVANLKKADLLWMISDFDPSFPQIKSGKLFEYIGSRKPVLGLLQPGAAADLLEEYTPGFIANVHSPEEIAGKLAEIFGTWKEGTMPEPDESFVQRFNRKNITGELASVFDKISSKTQARIS